MKKDKLILSFKHKQLKFRNLPITIQSEFSYCTIFSAFYSIICTEKSAKNQYHRFFGNPKKDLYLQF